VAVPVYHRVVLKLSGEAFAGQQGMGVDTEFLDGLAAEIARIKREFTIEMGIVVGGGNLWRGATGAAKGMDRATSDYMGMLGTVINALALQDALERHGVETRVQTAIEMRAVAEPYIRRRAMRHLEKGRVVIFAAGNGSPYFSTDTTAALRAAEIEADALLLAKNNVEGVLSGDPRKDKDVFKYDTLSYMDVLQKGLKVMDSTAASLCMDNNIPILVFGLMDPRNIERVLMGEPVGTIVRRDK
jgi:uridylate kinase